MNLAPTPKSLSHLAALVAGGASFSYGLGDFLDAFNRRPAPGALDEEPACLAAGHPRGETLDAFLVAVASSLARRQGWPAPA